MTWVTELLAAILVVAPLILLGAGRIDHQQALTLIGIGVGLIGGKQLSRLDRYLNRRYGHLLLMRKYSQYITAIKVGDLAVTIYLLPEFFGTDTYKTIVSEAQKLFPEKQVTVLRGERARLV